MRRRGSSGQSNAYDALCIGEVDRRACEGHPLLGMDGLVNGFCVAVFNGRSPKLWIARLYVYASTWPVSRCAGRAPGGGTKSGTCPGTSRWNLLGTTGSTLVPFITAPHHVAGSTDHYQVEPDR